MSTKLIPYPPSAPVLVQVAPFHQVAEMLLQGVAAGAGQADGVADGDAAVFAGEFDDPE